ncbi:MAG: hypothetical protein IH905_14035 [Proteobacteria bacterium]|nr:hypothetical protein [Pseudomonadota bacterium]
MGRKINAILRATSRSSSAVGSTLTIPETDIWRTAIFMLKHYGDTAWFDAAVRADEFRCLG